MSDFAGLLTRTRSALGLRPIVAPALFFVPLGIAIGPQGIGILTLDALAHLYPVIAIALAALGVVIGMGIRLDRSRERRLLAFATAEAMITVMVVTAGHLFLLDRWTLPLGGADATLAIVLGLCASATAASVAAPEDAPTHHAAMRMADLDDVLPVVLGGIVLAVVVALTPAAAVRLFALNVGGALSIALAGWLLLGLADDVGERAVFLLGTIGLLGGTAVYLGMSPMLAGLVAGALWRHAPGDADAVIRDDLHHLHHPLLILLLMCAGALASFGRLGLVLAVVYILTRFTGKLLGGWLVSRALPEVSPADLGSFLISPGVVGLGFALSFQVIVPSVISGVALTAVTIGTLVSEVLAAFAMPRPERP